MRACIILKMELSGPFLSSNDTKLKSGDIRRHSETCRISEVSSLRDATRKSQNCIQLLAIFGSASQWHRPGGWEVFQLKLIPPFRSLDSGTLVTPYMVSCQEQQHEPQRSLRCGNINIVLGHGAASGMGSRSKHAQF